MNLLNKGKSLLVLGAVVLANMAQASLVDATILIDRAANNKTLTVRYDGAKASLVEMRINGKSVASRTVSADIAAGETNFAVDLAALEDGTNEVEIRLYDAENKILGKETTVISVDRSGVGPVYITTPKKNETVQGYAEIKVGFRSELKNVYVSFFVNDEFKILKNFAPYNYLWDTTTVPNGWHEVQAWVVDESNATFKTEKMRLFVNNPGGRTKRNENPLPENSTKPTEATKPAETTKPANTKVNVPDQTKVGGIADVRPVNGQGNLGTGPRTTTVPVQDPKTNTKGDVTRPGSIVEIKVDNTTKPVETVNTKPVQTQNQDLVTLNTGKIEAPKLPPVAIGFGSRVDYTGTFDVFLNGELVAFDVAPRVVDGVPISPFRHLFEGHGGEVKWSHESKEVEGLSEGLKVWFRIGDPAAMVNGSTMVMETSPYLLSGRSMVPLSFMSEALKVNVQFDASTGHVLIRSDRSKK